MDEARKYLHEIHGSGHYGCVISEEEVAKLSKLLESAREESFELGKIEMFKTIYWDLCDTDYNGTYYNANWKTEIYEKSMGFI